MFRMRSCHLLKEFVFCIIFFISCMFFVPHLFAAQIKLSNGDRIHGEILQESEATVTLKSVVLGELTIQKTDVLKIHAPELEEAITKKMEAIEEGEAKWDGKLSVGYAATTGVTETQDLSLEAQANRNTEKTELNLKADYYLSKDGEDTTKKDAGASARYAFEIWEAEEVKLNEAFWDHLKAEKLQNFYKLEAEHDELGDIEYRFIGTVGISYWFDDRDDWKARFDLGIGASYTRFLSGTEDEETEPTIIPSIYLEKKIAKATLSEELTVYPVLGALEDYRLTSTTKLSNPINEKLSLDLSLIDEYDNRSSTTSDKNELRFISALTYAFK